MRHREAAMLLDVPDYIVKRAEANATDLYICLAIQLYTDNRIDHGDACRLAGVSAAELNRELLARNLTVLQYPPAKPHVREAG